MKDSERLIAEWSNKPYMSHRKRHYVVENRILARWYPGVGCDIVQKIKCDRRGLDDWTTAKTWEFRDHGVESFTTPEGKGLP